MGSGSSQEDVLGSGINGLAGSVGLNVKVFGALKLAPFKRGNIR